MAEQRKKPVPTLVLGLGGSGAWSVVYLKQALMDTYGNHVPENIALVSLDTLGTVEETKAHVGSTDFERKTGEGFGGVRLSPTEYAHLGGDAYDFALQIRGDQHPNISSWFQSEWKLRKLARGQWNLDQGAGMYRQMGRLALFYDLLNPQTSVAKQRVEDKLLAIRKRAEGNSIAVMIVGSLTGGTGAGLFIDMAHIVRQVAKANSINLTVRGFFFLPQAFARVLSDAAQEQARQRSFAAMRELERLLLHEDSKYGYPMHYVLPSAGMNQRIYRSEIKEKLYDFVYLIDGAGANRRLNDRPLKDGIAPMVGDAMLAYIDHHFGTHEQQYINNVNSLIQTRQAKEGREAYVGSIGAYSIVLPIQNIIESWSYRLALETIRTLVPPAEQTQDGDYIMELSAQANLERADSTPTREVESTLSSDFGILDPTDPEGRREFKPTRLWREAFEIYTESRHSERNAEEILNKKGMDSWRRMLEIPMSDADDTIQRVLEETAQILNETADDYVKTSDARKADPRTDHRNVKRKAEDFIFEQLGPTERGGKRQGGEYGKSLKRLADMQIHRYREAMTAYIMLTLNGERATDQQRSKQGKLGWLIRVYEEMRTVFDTAQALMTSASRSAQSLAAQETTFSDGMESAAEFMEEKAKGINMNPLTRRNAIGAQRSYLDQVQQYVDHHRELLLKDYVRYSFVGIVDFIDDVLENFKNWKQLLATDNQSLYRLLLDSSRRIQNERLRANTASSRWVINDPTWEDRRYTEYIQREDNADQGMLAQWEWKTALVKNTRGEITIELTAQLGDKDVISDMMGNWFMDNRDTMLGAARTIFQNAVQDINVTNYLMSNQTADGPEGTPLNFIGNPDALGDFLFQQSGHQLALTAGGAEQPTVTILAKVDQTATSTNPSRVTPSVYLNRVLNQLAARAGVGGGDDGTSNSQQLLECDDPFRLTVVSGAEVIPVNSVKAYVENRSDYLRLVKDIRKVTHIFPEEVRAVDYEEMLPTLDGQKRRVLDSAMVDVIGDEKRLRQFLYLMAYNVIKRYSLEGQGNEVQFYFALDMEAKNYRDEMEMRHYWLIELANNPSFLEAARTYILRKKDIREFRSVDIHNEDLPDYAAVGDYLRKIREQVAEQRIDKDELALSPEKLNDAKFNPETDHPFDEELRLWIEYFMPPPVELQDEETGEWYDGFDWGALSPEAATHFMQVAEMVVQHDVLNVFRYNLEQSLPALGRKKDQMNARMRQQNTSDSSGAGELSHDDVTNAVAEYDFYSVAVLALRNQISNLRRKVKDFYLEATGKPTHGL